MAHDQAIFCEKFIEKELSLQEKSAFLSVFGLPFCPIMDWFSCKKILETHSFVFNFRHWQHKNTAIAKARMFAHFENHNKHFTVFFWWKMQILIKKYVSQTILTPQILNIRKIFPANLNFFVSKSLENAAKVSQKALRHYSNIWIDVLRFEVGRNVQDLL